MHYRIRISLELEVQCPENMEISELIDKMEINPEFEGHPDIITTQTIEDIDWEDDDDLFDESEDEE